MEFDLSELTQNGLKLCKECESLFCTNCQTGKCAACHAPLCDLCYTDAGIYRDQCMECASQWSLAARKLQNCTDDDLPDYPEAHFGVPRKF